MITLFIALFVAVIGLNLFSLTSSLFSVNRILINTPKAIFQASIPTMYDDDEYIPYFDKTKIEQSLTYYYDENLLQYCNNYDMNLIYYNLDDESYCLIPECQGIKVDVTAYFRFDIRLTRVVYYEIQKGAYGD